MDDLESEKLEKGIQACIVEIITQRENEESIRTDFLGKLMEANKNTHTSKKIPVEDIVDECKTFYFAGHETTTSLLSWTILLLAINQEWQEKARKEVIELFGHKNPNPNSMARMKIVSTNFLKKNLLKL